MPIIRKVRKVGGSLMISIPSALAEAYNIKENTEVGIMPHTEDTIELKPIKEKNI